MDIGNMVIQEAQEGNSRYPVIRFVSQEKKIVMRSTLERMCEYNK